MSEDAAISLGNPSLETSRENSCARNRYIRDRRLLVVDIQPYFGGARQSLKSEAIFCSNVK